MKKHNYLLTVLFASVILISACSESTESDPQGVDGSEFSANFEELVTLTGFFAGQDPGFSSSPESNELFFVFRHSGDNPPDTREEVMLRLDLEDNSLSEFRTFLSEGASRELHVMGDEIKVISNTHMSSYPLDWSSAPSRITVSNQPMTRFGSIIRNGEIYVWGGELDNIQTDNVVPVSDKIKKWNPSTNSYDIVATMPTPKTWADGELINDKLYIFGGQAEFINTPPQSSIFVYDFNSGSFDTFELPTAINVSYTATYGEKIIVAGKYKLDPTNPDPQTLFGFFDTTTNTFTEVETNLSDDSFQAVQNLTIIDNVVYVVHGDHLSNPEGSPNEWTIRKATLDF